MEDSELDKRKQSISTATEVTVANGDIATVIQFDGILHRFHRTELKPVYFGMKKDSGLLILCYLSAWLVYHMTYIFVWWVEKRQPFSVIWETYTSDKILMTGLLMSTWFIGYNAASYAIWAGFEYRLERDAPPDDFEVIRTGEAFDTGLSEPDLGEEDGETEGVEGKTLGKMTSQTLLVTMPSGELVIGTNTRQQSAASQLILNSHSDNPLRSSAEDSNSNK